MEDSSEPRCVKGHLLAGANVAADGRCRRCQRDRARRRNGTQAGDELVICALCGGEYRTLACHLRLHGMNVRDYREEFPGMPVTASDLLAVRTELMHDRVGDWRSEGRMSYWDVPLRHWTDEQVLRAIRKWTRQHKLAPEANDWVKGTDEHPCTSVVCKRFGGWLKALDAAGVLHKRRRRKWTPERYAKLVRPLTNRQVIAIRRRAARGESHVAIAADHDVTPTTIGRIASGKSYANVGGPRSKGIVGTGARHRRLHAADVVAIRRAVANGSHRKAIAAEYGVSDKTIQGVVSGERYANVGGPITPRQRHKRRS